jgi:anaerobic selenocysteine-containing dehydrogenase
MHLQAGEDGAPRGFPTATRRVELYSERLLDAGTDPLPEHDEPSAGDRRYPLVLTCAKVQQYCQSQHRALPGVRRSARHPVVAMHPDSAARRGIDDGSWVEIVTDNGRARACARFDADLDERVVCAGFGWWQACPDLAAPGYEPLAEDGSSANYALLIGWSARDPISGSVPLRQYRCDVRPLTGADRPGELS